jgi:hypothetical protein
MPAARRAGGRSLGGRQGLDLQLTQAACHLEQPAPLAAQRLAYRGRMLASGTQEEGAAVHATCWTPAREHQAKSVRLRPDLRERALRVRPDHAGPCRHQAGGSWRRSTP